MSDDKGKGSDRAVDVAGAARRLRYGVEAISQGAEAVRFTPDAFLRVSRAFAYLQAAAQDTSEAKRLGAEISDLRACVRVQQETISELLTERARWDLLTINKPAPYSDKGTSQRKPPMCGAPDCALPECQPPEDSTDAIPPRSDPMRGVAVIDLWGTPGAGWGWS